MNALVTDGRLADMTMLLPQMRLRILTLLLCLSRTWEGPRTRARTRPILPLEMQEMLVRVFISSTPCYGLNPYRVLQHWRQYSDDYDHTGILGKTALMVAAGLEGKHVDYIPTEWILKRPCGMHDDSVKSMIAKTRMANDITWVSSSRALSVYTTRPRFMGLCDTRVIFKSNDDKEEYAAYCKLAKQCGFKVTQMIKYHV
jgi:hypothetical protein